MPLGSQIFWLAEQVSDLYASYLAGITLIVVSLPHSQRLLSSSRILAFTNITELFLSPPVVPTNLLNSTPLTLKPFKALLKSFLFFPFPSLTTEITYWV